MREMSEREVEALAKIFGGFSSAALALTNAEHRRAAGEIVRFFYVKGSITVHGMPTLPTPSPLPGAERSDDAA